MLCIDCMKTILSKCIETNQHVQLDQVKQYLCDTKKVN